MFRLCCRACGEYLFDAPSTRLLDDPPLCEKCESELIDATGSATVAVWGIAGLFGACIPCAAAVAFVVSCAVPPQ